MKIRIDEVVTMLMFIDGSVYLDIDSEEHLDEVLEHLESMRKEFTSDALDKQRQCGRVVLRSEGDMSGIAHRLRT